MMKRNTRAKEKKPDLHQAIRHLGVIVEDTNHKVDIIAEQYGDIKSEISGIKKTLDSHTEMIANLAVNLGIVKGDVEFMKHSLKRKVDMEEFAALERRVALLEKRTTQR